jgi:hypothetical protein
MFLKMLSSGGGLEAREGPRPAPGEGRWENNLSTQVRRSQRFGTEDATAAEEAPKFGMLLSEPTLEWGDARHFAVIDLDGLMQTLKEGTFL